ncbi:hypothetical protein P879_08521 [Paragonimus westermani]|uniref:Uncharacterized protein n=1 Tax=Paragonimus westermani TaxID=34504 RepID=A0A8T0DI07_9TREM|nr:hypothetical protein P879_08521 [Paragonimus westermani]
MAKYGGGYQMTLSWIPAKDGYLPERAIDAGHGVYVCRAKHNDEMIPGRLLPQNGRAYISHGGLELPKEKYEVLCNTSVQSHKCPPKAPDPSWSYTVMMVFSMSSTSIRSARMY